MNEAGLPEELELETFGLDTVRIERYIEATFPDAWKQSVHMVPVSWIRTLSFKNSDIYSDLSDGTGYVVLPDDFYLLVAFRMDGWRKSVYKTFESDDKTALLQSNEYTRGSEIRPVCLIRMRNINENNKDVVSPDMRNVLEYYSLRRGLLRHSIKEAYYIPVCRPLSEYEQDEELELDSRLTDVMAYLSASTVFMIFEKGDIVQNLQRKAADMVPCLKD